MKTWKLAPHATELDPFCSTTRVSNNAASHMVVHNVPCEDAITNITYLSSEASSFPSFFCLTPLLSAFQLPSEGTRKHKWRIGNRGVPCPLHVSFFNAVGHNRASFSANISLPSLAWQVWWVKQQSHQHVSKGYRLWAALSTFIFFPLRLSFFSLFTVRSWEGSIVCSSACPNNWSIISAEEWKQAHMTWGSSSSWLSFAATLLALCIRGQRRIGKWFSVSVSTLVKIRPGKECHMIPADGTYMLCPYFT